MSRRELAEAANAYIWRVHEVEERLDETDIGRLERGENRWPRARRREALRAVLRVGTDAELGFYVTRRSEDGSGAADHAVAAEVERCLETVDGSEVSAPGTVGAAFPPADRPTDVIAGQRDAPSSAPAASTSTAYLDWRIPRRAVLRCACGGLMATGVHHICDRCGRVQRVIQALELVISNGADELGVAVDSLDELVLHYAQTVCTLPPSSVYDDLFSVRSYAGVLLDRVGCTTRRRSDLVVVTGWLSSLLAVVTCDMGDHAASLVWCADAERHSGDARHPELAAWAALTRVMIAFYQGRAGRAVTLAGRGQQVAPLGTAVHAKLAAQEMRAWALLGKPDEMARAKRRAAHAVGLLPADVATTGVFSINVAEDPPYTGTSLLLVRRYREAMAATNRVLEAVYRPGARDRAEQPSAYARSLLILALAQAGLGQVDAAAAAGRAALDSARPVWPTMVLAGRLDQILSRDFAGVAEAADYHARYAGVVSAAAGRPRLATQPEDRG